MANGNNAVVSAKASLNEARGMFNIGDLSEKGYMRELKKAEKGPESCSSFLKFPLSSKVYSYFIF